ncbi:MAG: acyl-CoA dehydrogenase family protein [Polyangiaceae bacterium]|jgi:alkylation response protein AidB-like acyl-CoA dehydrogenase
MVDPIETAEALARELAETAVARDRAGGTPKRQRDRIRESGLLGLIVPARLGGGGASWDLALRSVRAIARADGSVAHLFGFQHLLLATVRLFGNNAQFASLASQTVERRWFWGNALNPLDTRTTLVASGADWVLRGQKSFCSGARDADMLIASATDGVTGKLVVAAIPGNRAGVVARDDWDNMGQRQTDSGTVLFEDVVVRRDEILSDPGPLGSTLATLRPLIAQLTLANLYLGIAEGAFAAGRQVTLERGRAWFASGVERRSEDPYVQATFGDLYAELEACRQVTCAAARRLDDAWSRGDDLTVDERGHVAIAVAAAKIVTTRGVLDVTNRIFESAGASSTTARLGLDRFWRNARTQTLHDPVEYKRRDVGRWLLTDEWPTPSFYS